MVVAAACSCGKDSLYQLECAKELGIKVDFVYSTLCWFDSDTPADLPDVYESKLRIKQWVEDRYGIPFYFIDGAFTFFDRASGSFTRGSRVGRCRGFPLSSTPSWCQHMKVQNRPKADIYLIGIASDEYSRIGQLSNYLRSPMYELGRTELDAFRFCEAHGVLLPSYYHGFRDGCWFCPKQNLDNLRRLRIYYPNLWYKLLQLDSIVNERGGTSFRPNCTVHDLDSRFQYEGYQDRLF